MKKIQAGMTVENFINDLNTNFDELSTNIDDVSKNANVQRTIILSTSLPSGGKDGDIWIVYEQN